LRWPRDTLYQLKLALTSSAGCGRLVGIVRLRTKTTEFSLCIILAIIFRGIQPLSTTPGTRWGTLLHTEGPDLCFKANHGSDLLRQTYHSSELGREQSLRIFEKKKLRRICRPKREEVATEWKKCIMISFIPCSVHIRTLVWSNEGGCKM
jgi:hypothetical protein